MKKLISVLFVFVLLFGVVSFAEAKKPDDKVFANAKECVQLIVKGSYDKAISAFGLPVTEDQLMNTVKSFKGNIKQTDDVLDVAVAWNNGTSTFLAVPVEAPHDNAVPAFVFTLSDDCSVTGIQLARWKEVEAAYKAANGVIWNKEYNPGFIVVVD